MYYPLLLTSYLLALFLPAAAFLALAFVLALRYRSYATLVVAAFIDIQFGFPFPMYVLMTSAILLAAEFMRPRLMLKELS